VDDNEKQHYTGIIDSLNIKSSTLTEVIKDLRKDNKIAQKEYADSLVNYHNYTTDLLARYGVKVDTLSNSIKTLNYTAAKEIPPTLTILLPPAFDTIHGEKILSYDLNCMNADAHLISYSYAFIGIKDNALFGKPTIYVGNSINYTSIIAKDDSRNLLIFIDRFKSKVPNDTFSLAMEFTYKGKNNIRQTPLRKIFTVVRTKEKCLDVSNEIFFLVAKYLKKYKIWNKFYDL
jgi:hypothetical protein